MSVDFETQVERLRESLAHAREAERKARADHDKASSDCDRALAAKDKAQADRDKALAQIREIAGELAVMELVSGSSSPGRPVEVEQGGHAERKSRIRKRTGRKKSPEVIGSKPPVAQLITDALTKAGADGVSGADLNRIVEELYSTDASEKAKSRMRKTGSIVTHRQTQMWYLPTHAPEGCE